MSIAEATAVYLYLQHQKRNSRQERAFTAACDVICQEAEKLVDRVPAKQGDIE